MEYHGWAMTQDPPDPFPELMIRYQAGDQAAFDEIYRLSVRSIESYLSRWARSTSRDDLVQETYLQVHRARRTYRPDLPFRPWLFSIARHVALWAARTRQRRWSKEIGMDQYPEKTTEEPRSDFLLRRQIEMAIERLPANQREVVWLSQVEGMSSAEISSVIGVTPGAIKVRLHRANIKLRSWLEAIAPGGGMKEEGVD